MIKSFKEKDTHPPPKGGGGTSTKASQDPAQKQNKFDKRKSKNRKSKTKNKQKDKSIIELIQMFVMKGNLDIFRKVFCCCRGKPSRIQSEVQEIEDIERLLVK